MIETLSNNKIIIMLLAAVIITGALLMLVSQEVYNTERQVKKIGRENQIMTWEVRSLSGELSYLTRPDRLDQLLSAVGNQNPKLASQNPVVITPVDFSAIQSNTVIPSQKPHKPTRPQTVSIEKSPVPTPQKSSKQQKSFSSLLDAIGGEE